MWGQLAGRVADSVKDVDVRRAMSRVVDAVAPEIDNDDDDDDDDEYDDVKEEKQPKSRGLIGLLSRVIPQEEEEEYEEVYEEVYEEEDDDDEAAVDDEEKFVTPSQTPTEATANQHDWLEQPAKEKPPVVPQPAKLTTPKVAIDGDEWVPTRLVPSAVELTSAVPISTVDYPKKRPEVPTVKAAKQKIPISSKTSETLIVPSSPLRNTTLPETERKLIEQNDLPFTHGIVMLPSKSLTPTISPIVNELLPTSLSLDIQNATKTLSPLLQKALAFPPAKAAPSSPSLTRKPLVKKDSPSKQQKPATVVVDVLQLPHMEPKTIDLVDDLVPSTTIAVQTATDNETTKRRKSKEMVESLEKVPIITQSVVEMNQFKEILTVKQPLKSCVEEQNDVELSQRPIIEKSMPLTQNPAPAIVLCAQPEIKSPALSVEDKSIDAESAIEVAQLEQQCKTLETQLENAEKHIVAMQMETARRMDEEDQWRQELTLKAKQDESRLVEAYSDAALAQLQQKLLRLKESLEAENFILKEQLQNERAATNIQLRKLQQELNEAEARTKASASDMQNALTLQNASATQQQQRQLQTVRLAEDKLAQTLACLDDKDEEIINLKSVIKDLRATVLKNQEGSIAMEKELNDVRKENEILHHNIEVTEEEQEELQKQLEHLEGQAERTSQLQIELKMLKESRDRELAKSQSTVADVTSHKSNLEIGRNAALARAQDLKQQLTVALADVDVARSDTQRALLSNANLQRALESFQSEREAELEMLDMQKQRDEEVTAAAHAAAIQATHEANESKLRQAKCAADIAIKEVVTKLQILQGKVTEYEKDNLYLRRSLDEAIHRLQSTQEDVVDRAMMKNILLDWFSKTGKNKKQVLEVMASMLHFTDSEKEKCSIYEGAGSYEMFVGAVVAPLPAAAKEVDTLEGENVREKWVNFLLAETDADL